MGNEEKNLTHFGGKDKTRGMKHRKDKEKYRPKSAKDSKVAPQKLKQSLGSNWDRYDKDDDSQSFQLSSSTDFSILAKAPITQGQHFQFKQDKLIAEETEKTPQELFSLDLNTLKHSILTVPFHERVGIDEKYFTENQLCYMKKNAEVSLMRYNEKYNNSIKSTEEHTQELCISNDNDTVDKTERKDLVNVQLGADGADVEISELTDKMNDLVKPATTRKTGKAEDDLEQWLDDILDQ